MNKLFEIIDFTQFSKRKLEYLVNDLYNTPILSNLIPGTHLIY